MARPLSFPPVLPPGRHLDLHGRGTTFVRELQGPPGAPTVLLLHGWLATADLNWWTCYRELGRAFHVVAMDHRGHGRGIHARTPFRLADCAADAAAVLRALDTGPAIVVGYSMGGPIAQLMWRDHRELVRGLVLCATSRSFPSRTRERAIFSAGAYSMMLAPAALRRRMLARVLGRAGRNDAYTTWFGQEVRGHQVGALVEAGRELARFNSKPWIGEVNVPAACIVMTRDDVVSPRRQYDLARAIPGASLRELDADHLACARRADRFVPVLVSACREVAARGEVLGQARGGVA